MFSAALAILVAGVGFGWQPVAGNGGASEVVVQVDRATLERLGDGSTIPLSVDVPAAAGRVARVRLEVTDAKPTGRREVTRLKPIGEPSNIVLTQYSEPDARYGASPPNYGAPPSAAQPLATTPAPQTFDPYTQAPPTAAPAATWNTDAAADSLAAPLQRIGSEIQTAAQPLQDASQRVGDGMRQFGQNIADRADQLRDSLGRPLQNGLLGGANGAGAAPPVTAANPGVASQWNGAPPLQNSPTTVTQPLNAMTSAAGAAASAANGAASNWNADAPPLPGAGSDGGLAPGGPPAPFATGANGARATNSDQWTSGGDSPFRGGQGTAAGPVAGGNFGSSNGQATSDQGNMGGFRSAPGGFGTNGGFGAPGSTLPLPNPPSLTTTSNGLGSNGPLLGPPSGAATTTATGAPEVRSWMLGEASNRGLDGPPATASSAPLSPPAIGGQPTGGLASPPALGGSSTTGGSTFGPPSWANSPSSVPTANAPTANTIAAGGAQSDGRHQAAVILAWVLLFASVAGNMYLFWSYLDVRTKYRALVRKTARAVGSRFSAA